jgi:hypothetical protein
MASVIDAVVATGNCAGGRLTQRDQLQLIHGGGVAGWYWHLVERELWQRGHDTVAPDLPCEDDAVGLPDYADVVIDAIGDRRNVAVAAQSFGGFTAPLVAAAGFRSPC